MSEKIVLFWFRRDLRLDDNSALNAALSFGLPVLPVFIFDTNIIDELPENDRRVCFIYAHLSAINAVLKAKGKSLLIKKGDPKVVFEQLLLAYDVQAVYANEDFEPYGINRDLEISQLLKSKGSNLILLNDSFLLHPSTILKNDGTPYTIYTPYCRRFIAYLEQNMDPDTTAMAAIELFFDACFDFPSLEAIGFANTDAIFPITDIPHDKISNYHLHRDYPSLDATTHLGVHLRFGTISIRKLFAIARNENYVFLNELIWREFYMMILYHFPRVQTHSFKSKYENIAWLNSEADFERWKMGETGYPLVDAGMRQLMETGFMHNRLRMLTASFLTKHLLIDWRWGEAWFARHLLDYELSSNNGGWQWAASSGCDSVPYFRIFNPYEQARKFDADQAFVNKYVPEVISSHYPKPMVEHTFARARCLEAYKKGIRG